MFSFVGDTVLDPFCGTGTTIIASLRHQRNSIGVEIDPEYCRMTVRYLKAESGDLFSKVDLSFERSSPEEPVRMVKEDPTLYKVKPARAKLE
jgi:modification methylase